MKALLTSAFLMICSGTSVAQPQAPVQSVCEVAIPTQWVPSRIDIRAGHPNGTPGEMAEGRSFVRTVEARSMWDSVPRTEYFGRSRWMSNGSSFLQQVFPSTYATRFAFESKGVGPYGQAAVLYSSNYPYPYITRQDRIFGTENNIEIGSKYAALISPGVKYVGWAQLASYTFEPGSPRQNPYRVVAVRGQKIPNDCTLDQCVSTCNFDNWVEVVPSTYLRAPTPCAIATYKYFTRELELERRRQQTSGVVTKGIISDTFFGGRLTLHDGSNNQPSVAMCSNFPN